MNFSITFPESGYLRTFEAEINVRSENELLVRGQIKDHRFAFEHAWILRTPDYEIIEEIAQKPAKAPPGGTAQADCHSGQRSVQGV